MSEHQTGTTPGPAITRHLQITGRVQGVGYRAWAAGLARDFGLQGWVQNEADGSVTALVQGPADTVAQFCRACEAGPGPARVDVVMATDTLPQGDLQGFDIRR